MAPQSPQKRFLKRSHTTLEKMLKLKKETNVIRERQAVALEDLVDVNRQILVVLNNLNSKFNE